MALFPAHIRTDEVQGKSIDTVQSVTVHCRTAAEYAEKCLSSVGLPKTACLAGLLHDCGKFTQAFSDYIWAAYRGENVRRGSVNHTFAGVQYLLSKFHTASSSSSERLTSELIAYAIGAHHGLFDLMKDRRDHGFPHRMEAADAGCDEAIQNFLLQCADETELEQLFQAARKEITTWFSRIKAATLSSCGPPSTYRKFYLALLSRLILSAVVEGDRRDTAEFLHRRVFPETSGDRTALWQECLSFTETKLGEFPRETPIHRARAEISDLCRECAIRPGGIYRLSVPTGGGKTLASLRYALAHAAEHRKQRIFFVIPLLSIIDQNSKVIRSYLPRQDILLEHHSNVVRTEECGESLDPRELLAENWSAPMIITTLVQLLNTLFSGKLSCIRRFQSLCNSVIIFDEVQTVPPKMLSLFNMAINFLSAFCGTTVVLCSATQPCLERTPRPLLHEPEELIPCSEALWAPFRRTHMEEAQPCTLEELPSLILDKLSRQRSLLVVCNKKDQARFLYHALSNSVPCLFHLSASMCMAHRQDTLDRLTAALDPRSGVEKGILCISTQVIEAGVDISFDCVIRLLAGMDNAVQAAGRCNRNGESESPAPVYVLRCKDEDLSRLKDIRNAQNASAALLAEFRRDPEQFAGDLTSDASIAFYYRRLYQQMTEEQGADAQDFPVPSQRDTIFRMLSDNPKQTQFLKKGESRFILHQSFQTAGQAFQVFDEDTVDVLVPYGPEGMELIADLCSARAGYDISFTKGVLERAKPYTISLFQYQYKQLADADAFYPTAGQAALVLKNDFYDVSTGLSMVPWTAQTTEVNICNIPIL